MYLHRLIGCILLTVISYSAIATVGGPSELRYIGSELNAHYFLLEFHDEIALAPELWKYDSESDSLFIIKGWINYPVQPVEDALSQLKQKLTRADTVNYDHTFIFDFKEAIQAYSQEHDLYYDVFPITVLWNSQEYALKQCFNKENEPKVIFTLNLIDKSRALSIIRYFGICMETGYDKDTLLIQNINFISDPQVVAEIPKPVQDDQKIKYLVIFLLFLTVVMMVIILVKKN